MLVIRQSVGLGASDSTAKTDFLLLALPRTQEDILLLILYTWAILRLQDVSSG